MRAILFILIIVVLIVIAGLATGFLNIDQIRGGQAPKLSTNGKGVTAQGGQAPAFDVQAGSVKVGSTQTTMKVPTLQVVKPTDNQAAATTNNSM
jgi:hypothetical protein